MCNEGVGLRSMIGGGGGTGRYVCGSIERNYLPSATNTSTFEETTIAGSGYLENYWPCAGSR